jgi:AcrR family transcriptional regulator
MADKNARTFHAGPLRIRVSTPGPASRPAPKERLTAERIVDVALEVMAADGYEAASMRRIARELGTGPASLYAHVANREELDQLVVDRVAAQMPTPVADPDRWDEQVKQFTRDALDVYRAHPGTARATLGMIPSMEGSLQAAETLMSLCLAGGVPPQAAAWFCDLSSLYVTSIAVEEAIWVERQNSTPAGEEPDHVAIDVQLRSFMESLPADRFPHVTSMAAVMVAGEGPERFEFGLDVLLAGLAAVSEKYR